MQERKLVLCSSPNSFWQQSAIYIH